MIWDPPVDLVPVLTFLDRFSWVFSFQWIDPNEESAEVQGLQSAMEKIPTHWVEPLTCATFGNLKVRSCDTELFCVPRELMRNYKFTHRKHVYLLLLFRLQNIGSTSLPKS